MKPLELGDRVVRVDGMNESIGTIIETGIDVLGRGRCGYKVSGVGWAGVYTRDYIMKFDFEIGDLVLPKDEEVNHSTLGVIITINGNGSMYVRPYHDAGPRRRSQQWRGTFTPSFLKLVGRPIEATVEDDVLSPRMLDIYLGNPLQ